jgi:hypothetical protein
MIFMFLCPLKWVAFIHYYIVLDIVGLVDMKLICGIRIVGMNHKAKKEDKVDNLILNHSFNCPLLSYY